MISLELFGFICCEIKLKFDHKVFCSFCAMVERQFDTTVKIVRSDNDTEF